MAASKEAWDPKNPISSQVTKHIYTGNLIIRGLYHKYFYGGQCKLYIFMKLNDPPLSLNKKIPHMFNCYNYFPSYQWEEFNNDQSRGLYLEPI